MPKNVAASLSSLARKYLPRILVPWTRKRVGFVILCAPDRLNVFRHELSDCQRNITVSRHFRLRHARGCEEREFRGPP